MAKKKLDLQAIQDAYMDKLERIKTRHEEEVAELKAQIEKLQRNIK